MASEKQTQENIFEPIIRKGHLKKTSTIVWFLMFIFWTLISSVLTIQDLIMADIYQGKFADFSAITFFLNTFPFFYAWFAFTPLIFWFGNRFSLSQGKWGYNLIIHAFLCLLTVCAYLLVTSTISKIFVSGHYDPYIIYRDFIKRGYSYGHFEVVIYWAILGVGVSLNYYEKYREREREACRLLLHSTALESQLAKAQLDSLRMQLHPHFLFNTLHAISALMDDSPKRARRVIARLGELLRSTLEIAEEQTITLEREIVLTKLYLEIEQERFSDQLQVIFDVEPKSSLCLVPSLILQPLIENAIKHGTRNDEKSSIIKISVSGENNRVKIVVEDNGPGFSEEGTSEIGVGIGLSNTKARLEQLYAEDHEFSAFNSDSGGAIIEVSIPCQKEEERS